MKTILTLLFALFTIGLNAQDIKHMEAYLRGNDLATRYVVVLEDNTIWWFAPGQDWEKSSTSGLPSGYDVKHIAAYSYDDGSTRYAVVLSDNTIWWFAPGQDWKESSVDGLPSGYKVKSFEAYAKENSSRYVVVLDDDSIWWFAPGQPWKKSHMGGLPK